MTLFFQSTIKAFKAAKNQRISNTGILKSNSKVGFPSFSVSLHKYIFQHSLFQWTMTIMLALLAKCDILQMCRQRTIAPHNHSNEVRPESDWDGAQRRMAPNGQTDKHTTMSSQR